MAISPRIKVDQPEVYVVLYCWYKSELSEACKVLKCLKILHTRNYMKYTVKS